MRMEGGDGRVRCARSRPGIGTSVVLIGVAAIDDAVEAIKAAADCLTKPLDPGASSDHGPACGQAPPCHEVKHCAPRSGWHEIVAVSRSMQHASHGLDSHKATARCS